MNRTRRTRLAALLRRPRRRRGLDGGDRVPRVTTTTGERRSSTRRRSSRRRSRCCSGATRTSRATSSSRRRQRSTASRGRRSSTTGPAGLVPRARRPASRSGTSASRRYRGKPVLTWWQGRAHRRRARRGRRLHRRQLVQRDRDGARRATASTADGHEFALTPQGTALITIYHAGPVRPLVGRRTGERHGLRRRRRRRSTSRRARCCSSGTASTTCR